MTKMLWNFRRSSGTSVCTIAFGVPAWLTRTLVLPLGSAS
jgi:hypothetical protein